MTFVIATAAIAGFPLTAGFFSKDEILWGAWSSSLPHGKFVWAVLSVAALMTAFYMGRVTYLVFFGKYRGSSESWSHAHESPLSMTGPLMVLAVLALGAGFIGPPAVFPWENSFHHWLEPSIVEVGDHGDGGHGAGAGHAGQAATVTHAGTVFAAGSSAGDHAHSAGVEWALIGLATAIGLVGLAMAILVYRRDGPAERIASSFKPVYTTLRNLYWVDEMYEALLLRPFYALCRWFRNIDRWVVDGLVNAAGDHGRADGSDHQALPDRPGSQLRLDVPVRRGRDPVLLHEALAGCPPPISTGT